MDRNISGQNGFSLVSLLITVALTGIVAMGLSKMFSASSGMQSHLNLDSERTAIQRHINSLISCSKTVDPTINIGFDPTTCASTHGLAKVFGKPSGTLLIKDDDADPTKIGKWTVKAVCTPSGFQILIARPKDSVSNKLTSTTAADFHNDPGMTARTLSWTEKRAEIYPSDARPCSYEFSPAPIVATDNGICASAADAGLKTLSNGKNYKSDTAKVIYGCLKYQGGSSGFMKTNSTPTASIYGANYYGKVSCPSNTTAVAGMNICGQAGICAGFLLHSMPSFDGQGKPNGWEVTCWMDTSVNGGSADCSTNPDLNYAMGVICQPDR